MIQVDQFSSHRVRHAFFTREGGVSTGLYRSLNCGLGSRDDRARVLANRERALAAIDLPANALFMCHQHHSAIVVEAETGRSSPPRADGLVTTTPGRALGILTADCGPVLFADQENRVIGAAHAGWRGALSGVLEATIDAMVGLGARLGSMVAALGPTIGSGSYEVGPEFPGPFVDRSAADAAWFVPARREGHFMFDLPGYICSRLAGAGVAEVIALGVDTCADEDRCFSYRRSRLRGEPDFGRMLSVIALEE